MDLPLYQDQADQTMMWTVTAISLYVSDLLKSRVNFIWIRGEVGSFTRAQSGHWYFTIKDTHSQLRCVMFKARQPKTVPTLEIGQAIEIKCHFNLYAPRGDLQLDVEQLRLAGQGQLYEQFVQLKNRLENQGLFNPQHKKPIPPYPTTIAIVTSLQAAALHDVLTTLRRRAPHVSLLIYPASVQGSSAAAALAKAIEQINQDVKTTSVDTIILCRGGGSLEDLWAFNEEILAHAIFASQIPIISGVGHETDFTISDFVADARAATPTAAAELASPNREDLIENNQAMKNRLQELMARKLTQSMQQLDWLSRHLRTPKSLFSQAKQHLLWMQTQLHQHMTQTLTTQKHRHHTLTTQLNHAPMRWHRYQDLLTQQQQRLTQAWQHQYTQSCNQLEINRKSLSLLGPQAVLDRGYAVLMSEKQQVIRDRQAIIKGQPYQLYLANDRSQVEFAAIEPLDDQENH